MEFSIGRYIAAIRIDSKSSGRIPARNCVTDLAGDRDRSNPGQRVGKIAEPFAEPQRRCVGIERVCSDALNARAAPLDAETDRHHELMLRVLEKPIFKCGLEVLKSGCSQGIWSSGRPEAAVGRSKRHRYGLGDPLGKCRGYISLPEGGIVAGAEIGHGRKRQLIVDAGIVDAKGCREKAVTDDFVGDALSEWNERYGEPGKARAPQANRHENSPQS